MDIWNKLLQLQNIGLHSYKSAVIGKSFLGQEIFAFHKGNMRGKQIVLLASVHAREWATTFACWEMFDSYVGEVGVWFVPMVNIDGIELAIRGVDWITDKNIVNILYGINANSDFSKWKANANCVDINVNFPAKWGQGKSNLRYKSSANYIGKCPCSEPESKAVYNFVMAISPEVLLCYHCKGEVVYQGFDNCFPSIEYAQKISSSLGYQLEYAQGSCGGIKDWFIGQYGKLGLTIEIGKEKLDYGQIVYDLKNIKEQNKHVLDICQELCRE